MGHGSDRPKMMPSPFTDGRGGRRGWMGRGWGGKKPKTKGFRSNLRPPGHASRGPRRPFEGSPGAYPGGSGAPERPSQTLRGPSGEACKTVNSIRVASHEAVREIAGNVPLQPRRPSGSRGQFVLFDARFDGVPSPRVPVLLVSRGAGPTTEIGSAPFESKRTNAPPPPPHVATFETAPGSRASECSRRGLVVLHS